MFQIQTRSECSGGRIEAIRWDHPSISYMDDKQQSGEVRAFGEWISVNDRLPNVDERVLIVVDQFRSIARYSRYGSHDGAFLCDEGGRFIARPTHWMPLPETPKETA